MGWIKKIFIFILGLIALLAISLFTIKYLRSSKAAEIKVPANSYSLIKIDIDDIAIDLLKNSVANFSTYYLSQTDTAEKSDKNSIWNIGVKIPADIYLFSLSDTLSVYYSVFDVSNRSDAQSFLKNNLTMSLDSSYKSSSDGEEIFANKSIKILLAEKKMILAIGSKADSKLMTSILRSDQQDWVLAKNMRVEDIEISKSKVSYVDLAKNWVGLDFMNGKIEINGYYNSDLFSFPSNPRETNISEDNVISLDVNSDLSLILKEKQEYLKGMNLPVDSVYKYVGNFMSIQLKNSQVLETDTIITYDYDDNFEMIEKKTVQEIEVPDLTLSIIASQHLLGYLPDKMFYKFTRNYADGMINLSTNNELLKDDRFKTSKNVLSFVYNKRPSGGKYLSWLPIYEKVKSGTVYGKAISENEIKLEGKFIMENSSLNSFYQIFVQ